MCHARQHFRLDVLLKAVENGSSGHRYTALSPKNSKKMDTECYGCAGRASSALVHIDSGCLPCMLYATPHHHQQLLKQVLHTQGWIINKATMQSHAGLETKTWTSCVISNVTLFILAVNSHTVFQCSECCQSKNPNLLSRS